MLFFSWTTLPTYVDHFSLNYLQACNGIGSIQELLEGRQGLSGQEASDEAVKRVRKAQALLAKFFAESGVEDERVSAFIGKHSS